MDQEIEYKGVRTVIGAERDGRRQWAVFPQGAPPEGAISGIARADGSRGSFKEAVFASREAIDEWLVRGAASTTD